MGTALLNISNNWLLYIASHLFTQSVLWRFSEIHYPGFWVHGAPKEVYTSIIIFAQISVQSHLNEMKEKINTSY